MADYLKLLYLLGFGYCILFYYLSMLLLCGVVIIGEGVCIDYWWLVLLWSCVSSFSFINCFNCYCLVGVVLYASLTS